MWDAAQTVFFCHSPQQDPDLVGVVQQPDYPSQFGRIASPVHREERRPAKALSDTVCSSQSLVQK
jgi:hypothetical protein